MQKGNKYQTPLYGELVVVNYFSSSKVEVEFSHTGFRKTFAAYDIRAGRVRDPYFPINFNVGFVGEGEFNTSTHRQAARIWYGMLLRCYGEGSRPTYSDCSVTPSWYNFQVFAKWYYTHHIFGYHLDKDLTILGNRCYSPETCCFITPQLNSALHGADTASASFVLPSKRLRVQMRIQGRSEYLGTVDTKDEARLLYVKAKRVELLRQIDLPTTPEQVKAGILNFMEIYL